MDSWLPVATVLGLSAQSGLGSGEAARRPLAVEDCPHLTVRGSLAVTVRAGAPQAACLGDANLLDLVTATVSGDELVLELADEVEARHPPRVELWLSDLRRLEVRDEARLEARQLSGEVVVVAREAGQAELAGRVESLVVTGGEASRVEAAGCEARDLFVQLSGVARARLRGGRSLCAECSGASQLDCHGRPERRDVHCTGLAMVHYHREWGAPARQWARFLPPR